MSSTKTIVASITDTIATQIASREIPTGSRLASIRALAKDYDTTTSTIQRVIERLTALGFVSTQAGQVAVVEDIFDGGNMGTWPYMFATAKNFPDRAKRTLVDILMARNSVANEVIAAILKKPSAYRYDAFLDESRRLELALTNEPDNYAMLFDCELRISRAIVRAVDRPFILAITNTVAQILSSQPLIVRAIYEKHPGSTELLSVFSDIWQKGDPRPDLIDGIEAMSDVELQRIVDDYEALLKSA